MAEEEFVPMAGSKMGGSRMGTSLKMNTKGYVVAPGSKLPTKNFGSKMAGSKVNAARETQYQGISCPQTLIGKNTKRVMALQWRFPVTEEPCPTGKETTGPWELWKNYKPEIICCILFVLGLWLVCTPIHLDALCKECKSCWTGRWTGCNLFTRGFCKWSSHSCSGGLAGCAGECIKYLLWPFYRK